MRAMFKAREPMGRMPRVRPASMSASHTLSASPGRIHSSYPRSPVKPVRDTMIGSGAADRGNSNWPSSKGFSRSTPANPSARSSAHEVGPCSGKRRDLFGDFG